MVDCRERVDLHPSATNTCARSGCARLSRHLGCILTCAQECDPLSTHEISWSWFLGIIPPLAFLKNSIRGAKKNNFHALHRPTLISSGTGGIGLLRSKSVHGSECAKQESWGRFHHDCPAPDQCRDVHMIEAAQTVPQCAAWSDVLHWCGIFLLWNRATLSGTSLNSDSTSSFMRGPSPRDGGCRTKLAVSSLSVSPSSTLGGEVPIAWCWCCCCHSSKTATSASSGSARTENLGQTKQTCLEWNAEVLSGEAVDSRLWSTGHVRVCGELVVAVSLCLHVLF